MAINLSVTGFSDRAFEFAKAYIDLLLESANKDGFERSSIQHSIEKIKSEYANSGDTVDEKATNNRLLMLIPHTFHDKRVEKSLRKQIKLGPDFTYSPGVFLKEKIIENISSVQILVIGNTTKDESIKFCQENIVAKFNTVECNHESNERCYVAAGCIYQDVDATAAFKRTGTSGSHITEVSQEPSENRYLKQASVISSVQYRKGILGQIIWDTPATDANNSKVEEEESDSENESPKSTSKKGRHFS